MTEFLREITNDKLVPKVKTESKHNDLFESEETEEDEIYDDKSLYKFTVINKPRL